GLFVNTVPVRIGLGGDPPMHELSRRTGEAVRAALAHADAPFERIVEVAAVPRPPGGNPPFQILFTYQDEPLAGWRLDGPEARPFDVDEGTAKVDLTLTVERRAGGLSGALEYDTGLFDAVTAERIARGYARLVEALVAERGLRLSEVVLDLPGPPGGAVFGEDTSATAAHGRSGAPSALRAEVTGGAAPMTPLEEIVAGGWGGVPGLQRPSSLQNVFPLGGPSLHPHPV